MQVVSVQKGQRSHHMTDGWGLTTSDEHIIGSDGTAKLYFEGPDVSLLGNSINVGLDYVYKGDIWKKTRATGCYVCSINVGC